MENFLTFSRIERNRQRFEFTETRPSAVVESALAAMRERLQAPGCHLEVNLSPGLPTVLADQDALTTVLLNLLDNAFKYTPAEKRIRLRAYRKDGRLAFDVEDNGIGIAPRDQKRIFRRFYQVEPAAGPRNRRLRIGAEHRRVHCPRARRRSCRGEPSWSGQHLLRLPPLPPGGLQGCRMTHRILIVEDEPALLRGLKDTFEAQGYEVLAAQDGAAGLDLALNRKPDLILLDIMLPRVNGYEICRAVRSRGLEMPILMLTAKGQEEDIVLGLNLGADDYITKPFRRAELIARVNAFLRRARPPHPVSARFGEYDLNLAAHKLFRNGREVDLTAKEFRLLAYFLSRRGCALTRQDILDAVWGNSVMVTPRSIDRCVATLRAKIEPAPHSPQYIQTIRDIGYRFDAGAADPF